MDDLETTAKKQWCPETRLSRIQIKHGGMGGRNEDALFDQRGVEMTNISTSPFGKCLGFGCRAYDEQTVGKKSYSFCKKMRP